MKKVGFIGLGIMGRPMAKNLIKAGYKLIVYNRSKSPVNELVASGAEAALSPKDAAEKADTVITIVTDSSDVEQVILGPNGIIEGAKKELTVIDMSTISPRVTGEIASKLKEMGVNMLDAPVSGGDKGATEGTLSIMVGGDETVFKEHLPIFESLGKNITYMGPTGSGQITKLCNQVVGSLHLLAMSEGLALGAKAGLNLEKMLKAIGSGAAGSWMISNLAPKVLKRDFEPGFKVKLNQKDLRLALELAGELKLSLPGTSLVHQLYRAIEAAGLGDKGTQSLVISLEKLSGVQVSG